MRQGMTLVCCAVLAACGSSTTSGEVFHANMNAAQEIPAPNVAGFNPVGTAVFQNNGDGSVTYTVNATGLSTSVAGTNNPTTFTGMHIHFAAPGVAAGVVVPLTTPSLGTTAGVVAVTFTSRGSVSSPPSPNRACGSPAHGSPPSSRRAAFRPATGVGHAPSSRPFETWSGG